MSAKPHYKIPLRSTLEIDGVRWTVINKDTRWVSVESVDGAEIAQFSLDWLQDEIGKLSCKLVTPKDEAKRKELLAYTGGIACLTKLHKKEQLNVHARLCLMDAIQNLEDLGHKITQRFLCTDGARNFVIEEAKRLSGDPHIFNKAKIGSTKTPWEVPQGRILCEWRDKYRYFDQNPLALMSRHHLKGGTGSRETKLSSAQIRFLKYFENVWQDPKKLKIGSIYKYVCEVFKATSQEWAEGYKPPSITTVRKWIKNRPNTDAIVAREGERQATNLMGAGKKEIRAQFFGEEVETDQVLLSLFINDQGEIQVRALSKEEEDSELAPNEIRRVWLHYMIEVATRMPLAWVLAESADSDTTMELLRMATRSKEKEKLRYKCRGEPAPAIRLRKVTSDNGTAVRNAKVFSALTGMGATIKLARTYRPNDKPFVERMFKTLEMQVIAVQDGYTGGKPGALPGYDSKAHARLTADKLYGILTKYFIDIYPHESHRGTGMFGKSPVQKMREVIEKHREIEAPNVDGRHIHLGVTQQFKINSEGVQPFGIPFNSTALQNFNEGKGKTVNVHIDPDRLEYALITAEGHSGEPIKAQMSMTAYKDVTLKEFLDFKRKAAEKDPAEKNPDDEILAEARKEFAENSDMFPDSDDPESYKNTVVNARRAKNLHKVECRPTKRIVGSTAPGSIMNEARKKSESKNNKVNSTSKPEPESPINMKFGRITESKF